MFQHHISATKRVGRWLGIAGAAKTVCLAAFLVVLICCAVRASGAEPLGAAPSTLPSVAAAPADPSDQQPGPATPASSQPATAAGPSDAEDLRQLIGVRAPGIAPVELPKLPSMSLRGFVRTADDSACALLEVTDLNRIFLVKKGTEIPITVEGRLSPINQSELTGLGQSATPAPQPDEANTQTQIILKIINVSDEGVIVQAGLNDQTIVIR
ncbi:MAG: hypothetical protein ABSF29_08540 [Tepidisphaeraceae bacterium]